jgi:hypothetical protein
MPVGPLTGKLVGTPIWAGISFIESKKEKLNIILYWEHPGGCGDMD